MKGGQRIIDKKDYTAYDFDDLTPGHKLKLEHTVYYKDDTDLSDLISKPLDEVQRMRESNIEVEQSAYDKVREAAKEWEKAAAVTNRFDRAIEYLKVPLPTHTANQWVQDEYGKNTVSNAAYQMTYRIYEWSSWHSDTTKYKVRWDIYTNSPRNDKNVKIAEQERVFKSQPEAEKCIQGRIKAYAHLFTEISLPIPKEYEKCFKVYGHLLPGYTTVEMQKAKEAEKPSIRQQLNSLKPQEKPAPKQAKKRTEPEI